MYVFTHTYLPDKKLCASNWYINFIQEVPEYTFFVSDVSRTTCGGAVPAELVAFNQEFVNGSEVYDGPKLISNHVSNFSSEDISEIRPQWINVDDENYPESYKLPQVRGNVEASITTLNWKWGVGIWTRKSAKLKNSSAGFTNYARGDVLRMSRLDLFLFFSQWVIWSKPSFWTQKSFWKVQWIFNSSSSGLVVISTWFSGLVFQIVVTGS